MIPRFCVTGRGDTEQVGVSGGCQAGRAIEKMCERSTRPDSEQGQAMIKHYRKESDRTGSIFTGRFLAVIITVIGLVAGGASWVGLAIDREWQDRELWEDDLSRVRTAPRGALDRRDLRLNRQAMKRLLDQAPAESTPDTDNRRVELPLPLPDGRTLTFLITQSPVLDPLLAAKYPEIRTYTGQAIDDPAVSMRCDFTPLGFHATVIGVSQGTVSIHPPEFQELSDRYVSYFGLAAGGGAETLACDFREPADGSGLSPTREFDLQSIEAVRYQSGETLRTFRIAVAATWEYCNTFGGGRTADTVASIATWLNGVNAVYEREFAIRLRLVDAPTIIFSAERGFTAASDPFTNGSNGTLLGQVGPVLATFGPANFDVGHVLATGGGGVAYLGVVCRDDTAAGGPAKGLGVSSVSGSLGNPGGVYVLSHELGHQFGAFHTFNGTFGNCAGTNRTGNSAFEPGSGTTIMSYAGGCATDNIVTGVTGNFRFHVGSIRQINSHLRGFGRCFSSEQTSNNPPTVSAGPGYTIPVGTPFELRATGSDPDSSDAANLTYVWEQTDPGLNYSNPPYTDSGDPISTTRPIFRSYAPVSSPVRVFPSLNYILNYANVPPETINGLRSGESLPAVGRSLNFGVALRDNRSGGGGLAEDGVTLTVAGAAGPFRITSPNTDLTWTGGASPTVTWQVSNTNLSPVSCSQVRISLSTDGGQTFPIILSAATPNDGSEVVIVPTGVATTQARVKVEAVGNIFFDISDAGFTIVSSGSASLPTVTAISPNPAAPTANTPFSATLSGANFISGGTEVWFCLDGASSCNQLSPSSVTFNSTTRLALSGIVLTAGSWEVYVQTSAGASNRSVPFLVQSSSSLAPAITDFKLNPSSPVATEPFEGTITGSNFVSGQTRLFVCQNDTTNCSEQAAARISFVSSSSLAIDGLTLTAGSWQFYVQTPAGQSNRTNPFTVTPSVSSVPVIASFSWSPSTPLAGNTFSGTVKGSNFVIGATQVFFCQLGGSSCLLVPAESISVESQSSLSLTNVTLESGSWQFYLQTAVGNSARSASFTVQVQTTGVPIISGFTWDPTPPVTGQAFRGTITGDNFSPGATSVFFCQVGRPFCSRQSSGSVTVTDRTQLSISSVTLTTGSWQFYLENSVGVSLRSSTFTVQPVALGVPTVGSYFFDPITPESNQLFKLRLNGSGFVVGGTRLFFCQVDSDSCVEIESYAISVPLTTLLDAEELRLPAGTWQIQVQTSAGISARSIPFVIQPAQPGPPAPPRIMGLQTNPLNPTSVQPFTIGINGSGFIAGSTRFFTCLTGTTSCTEVPSAQLSFGGTTTITATAVSRNTGSWQVYVKTPGGDSPRSGAFIVQAPIPPPTISDVTLTPSQPIANKPFQAILTGSGFIETATRVLVCLSDGGNCNVVPSAGVSSSSATSLTLNDLRLRAGSWQFQVETVGGTSLRSQAFVVVQPQLEPPTLSAVIWTPAIPVAGIPFSGRLSGSNFVQDDTDVFICLEGTPTCLQTARTSIKFVDQNTLELGALSLAGGRWQAYVRTAVGESNRSVTFEVTTRYGTIPTLISYILRPTVPRSNTPFSGAINGTNFVEGSTIIYFCLNGSNKCQLLPSQNVTVNSPNSLTFSGALLPKGTWQLYLQTSISWTARSRPFLVQ